MSLGKSGNDEIGRVSKLIPALTVVSLVIGIALGASSIGQKIVSLIIPPKYEVMEEFWSSHTLSQGISWSPGMVSTALSKQLPTALIVQTPTLERAKDPASIERVRRHFCAASNSLFHYLEENPTEVEGEPRFHVPDHMLEACYQSGNAPDEVGFYVITNTTAAVIPDIVVRFAQGFEGEPFSEYDGFLTYDSINIEKRMLLPSEIQYSREDLEIEVGSLRPGYSFFFPIYSMFNQSFFDADFGVGTGDSTSASMIDPASLLIPLSVFSGNTPVIPEARAPRAIPSVNLGYFVIRG